MQFWTAEAHARLFLDVCELRLAGGRDSKLSELSTSTLIRLTSTPRTEQRPSEAQEALRIMLRWTALGASLSALVSPLSMLEEKGWLSPEVPRQPISLLSRLIPGPVGTRRAAEIALDEGELLALRLPGHAAPLLQQACGWFWAAGDPVGATQSAILWALASIHADAPDDARAALAACRTAYIELVAARPDDRLPDWPAVQDGARARDAAFLASAGAAWRGWLIRLAACLLWEASAQPPRGSGKAGRS